MNVYSKVVTYSITSVGHGADPGFLTVNLQVTLVINPVVGCCYFPPGPRLLSQPVCRKCTNDKYTRFFSASACFYWAQAS